MVAPVRETCAQVLGTVLQLLPEAQVAATGQALLRLAEQKEWEVLHGCFLGLRYLLAVRRDLASAMLPSTLPSALRVLESPNDEVRSVVAEALSPVSPEVLQYVPDQVSTLLQKLWDLLLPIDALSPSAKSMTEFIAEIYSQEGAMDGPAAALPIASLVPRLWPLTRHHLALVRRAALRTLERLLTKGADIDWSDSGLVEALLRYAFQSLLLEQDAEAAATATRVWRLAFTRIPPETLATAASSNVSGWCTLAGTPAGTPLDSRLILQARGVVETTESDPMTVDLRPAALEGKLGGVAGAARVRAAQALGVLGPVTREPLRQALETCAKASQASMRSFAALATREWGHDAPDSLRDQIHSLLTLAQAAAPSLETPYDEVSPLYVRLRAEWAGLYEQCALLGVSVAAPSGPPPTASVRFDPNAALAAADAAQAAAPAAAARVRETTATLLAVQEGLHTCVVGSAAAAVVACLRELPNKVGSLISPLMAELQGEPDEAMQSCAAEALVSLVDRIADRPKSSAPKVVGNLCKLACADPLETPSASKMEQDDDEEGDGQEGSRATATADASDDTESASRGPALLRRGGAMALCGLARRLAGSLFVRLPVLRTAMQIPQALETCADDPTLQTAIDALQVLETTWPSLDVALRKEALDALLPAAIAAVAHNRAPVRAAACKALAAIAAAHPKEALSQCVMGASTLLSNDVDGAARLGGARLTLRLVAFLSPTDLAPYAVALLVPLMGRMSDALAGVRRLASGSFAKLVPLLPLARAAPPPADLGEEQRARVEADGHFLEQLLDNTKVDDFHVPIPLTCNLRPYQQEGVNWLAFLRRFGLHGALCDDMGLGKTLQATAILASDLHEQRSKGGPILPALVICPPTLVGHWVYEVTKYTSALKPLEYAGTPSERSRLVPLFESHDLVVMSYESIRADADAVCARRWSYCILDEGHYIRNHKSKVSQAVRRVQANHRLLLSGTPIQNSVVELWALFEFLMPGFLGSEREFKAKYAPGGDRAAKAKRDLGALNIGALHKQVMPFILRRTKEEVLKDLPPKIIQDVTVELSPLQARLYAEFEGSSARNAAETSVLSANDSSGSGDGGAEHVFQALTHLRKLCSHPKLVLEPKRAASLAREFNAASPEKWLQQLEHAPKLQALRGLFRQLGIGEELSSVAPDKDEAGGGGGGGPAAAGHRVLVFAQLKSLLDIVESDLLKAELPGVGYLRLDGSVEPRQRFGIVKKFNADPSIEVLLLTTHVGGLGLNLTAADTVVFLEHDWNPQRDLQAMDRAHRLGQKRTVNVYRLLCRGTLEEKIMSLQRFKLDVANAVVNTDNCSLSTMDTGQLLELFTAEKGAAKPGGDKAGDAGAAASAGLDAAANVAGAGAGGLKKILTNLEELWNPQQQYAEFGLESFMREEGA